MFDDLGPKWCKIMRDTHVRFIKEDVSADKDSTGMVVLKVDVIVSGSEAEENTVCIFMI